ncbi:MAG: D-alanyl-D-alanine carboxypeptidase [Candidatus Binatia bacterium]
MVGRGMGMNGALGVLLGVLLAGQGWAAEPPLQALAAHVGAGQGALATAEDGTVLVAEAADRAVHPASVTKIATSLALLERLGPEYRFTTRVGTDGTLAGGVVHGDLLIDGGRDPFLVFEGAFLILRRLHALGVHTVEGRLRVRGPLLFNWQPDPTGARLERALAGHDGEAAWAAVDGTPSLPLAEAALAIRGRASGRESAPITPLVVHRSPPLLHVVKALNGYSNNVFHLVSEEIGGPRAVEDIARANVPEALRPEIVIDNAAGAGETNRLSPRAAVALLRALARAMATRGKALTDVLPVSGIDPGTLQERLPELRGMVVGKTGTFGSVGASALAGELRTRRYGVVTFAVLNHGVPVPAARARQDAFVRALAEATGAEPWPYTEAIRPTFTAAQVE